MRAVVHLRNYARRALTTLAQAPMATLWALLAASATIAVALTVQLGTHAFDAWRARSNRATSMVVYLAPTVTEADGAMLANDLRNLRGVRSAHYISAVESEQRLRQALSGSDQLLDGIAANSLPASVELELTPGMRDVIEVSRPFRALLAGGRVDDVVQSGEWTDELGRTYDALALAANGIRSMIAAIAALALFALIRLRLARNHPLRSVAHLLGAGPTFLRGPNALAGALLGALSASIACAGLTLGRLMWGDRVRESLGATLAMADEALAMQPLVLPTLGAATVIGLIAGALAGTNER